jgi:hypothetical protein
MAASEKYHCPLWVASCLLHEAHGCDDRRARSSDAERPVADVRLFCRRVIHVAALCTKRPSPLDVEWASWREPAFMRICSKGRARPASSQIDIAESASSRRNLNTRPLPLLADAMLKLLAYVQKTWHTCSNLNRFAATPRARREAAYHGGSLQAN